MVFPLYDENPLKWPVPPYATWGLIVLNLAIFCVELGSSETAIGNTLASFGTTPAILFHHIPSAGLLPAQATLLTSMFLHGSWQHLLGNMIYLWVFGDDIEEALGPPRFLAFYFLVGIAANVAYCASDTYSTMPVIGASGAIAGILAAYLLLQPCAKISVFAVRIVFRAKAYWVIGGWGVLQLYLLIQHPSDGVAYMAHIGGFMAGTLAFLALRPRDVRLFKCTEHPDLLGGYWAKIQPISIANRADEYR